MTQKIDQNFAREAMQYTWLQYEQSLRNDPKKWDKLEEPFAKHILQNTLSGYEIIENDDGTKNHMFDFLAQKQDHRIAIEVTQHTDSQALGSLAFIARNINPIQENKLYYNWIIMIDKSADISKSGKKKLIQLLEKLEARYSSLEKILSSQLNRRISEAKELYENGFIYFSGKRSINQQGSCKITSIIDPAVPNILEILKIAHKEATKEDNIKKLNFAKTNEKHIFIPITGFNSNAAKYLEIMPNEKQIFITQEIINKINTEIFLPDIIDVVWIATLREFQEKIGYRLAKIVNQKTSFTFEPITNGITSY